MYGRDPPHLFCYGNLRSLVGNVDQYLAEQDWILLELRGYLYRAQQLMKAKADVHRRHVEFEVGDWFFLKLKPYTQQMVVWSRNEKLAPRYYGLFISLVGKVAYRLKQTRPESLMSFMYSNYVKLLVINWLISYCPQVWPKKWRFYCRPEQVVGVRGAADNREVLIR